MWSFFVYTRMNPQPIGIFDSGLGGLSVFSEIQKLLPKENIIYYADSKNSPYGEKTEQEIYLLSKYITEFLIHKECKAIVIACNTATSAAINKLRQEFPIPFIGMEPAVKPAAENTKTGKVGILATEGTLNGGHYKTTSQKFAQHIETIIQPGYGLVELIENGQHESEKGLELIQKYITPMLKANVDHIVLGCTHYPFYQKTIQKIVPSHVKIMNPAPAVANRLQQVLTHHNALAQKKTTPYKFYTTGDKNLMERFLTQELDLNLPLIEII